MSLQETANQYNQQNITHTATKVMFVQVNCGVNVLLALTAIIGNSLVLHVARRSQTLRSPSLFLLCGLAMSDLAVGTVVQPLFIVNDLISLYSRSQRLKQFFMGVYNTFGFSLCGISLCTVTAIAVDRLIAVERSLHYPCMVTIPRVRRVLIAIWTICFIFVIASFWQHKIVLISLGIVICACLCISTICHVKIYRTVRYHQNVIKLQSLAVTTNNRQVPGHVVRVTSLKMSAFNAFIVFLVLIICYGPYLVVYYVVTSVNLIDKEIATSLTSTIVFVNSSLNPFLYCWRVCEIREAVKQTCRKFVCCFTY